MQRKEDTDEFISMGMESTTVTETGNLQNNEEIQEEKYKQQDLEKEDGTMVATNDEGGKDEKRPSFTEKNDRDNENNNDKDDTGINALFRTSSKSQQEKEATPKTTSKKKKKEKKTKKKKVE